MNILGNVNCGKLKSAFDSINCKLCGWLVLSNNVECWNKLTEFIFTVFWLLSGAMRAYAGIWCWYLQQGEGATGSHTSLSVRQNKSWDRWNGRVCCNIIWLTNAQNKWRNNTNLSLKFTERWKCIAQYELFVGTFHRNSIRQQNHREWMLTRTSWWNALSSFYYKLYSNVIFYLWLTMPEIYKIMHCRMDTQ